MLFFSVSLVQEGRRKKKKKAIDVSGEFHLCVSLFVP